MKTTSIVVALAMASLSMATLGGVSAAHPIGMCFGQQSVHDYRGAGYVGFISYGRGAAAGVASAWDTCPSVYDGETEFGVGGGRFVAGTGWCLSSAEIPHHSYGVGAGYWADDATGTQSVAYWAGADGPAMIQMTGCETDGVITNEPTTDPLDCGAGSVGIYAPPTWTPAGLAENVVDTGACNPFDGFIWVFLISGPYVDFVSGNVVVSEPVSGHIWDGSGGGGAPDYVRVGGGF